MEMNFQNPREVFVQNGLKNKNISHNLHRCQEQGESKPSLSPIFQASIFPVLVMILREMFRRVGDEIGKKKRGFCPEHAHIK
jgi:hypothetical protein